MPFIIHLLVLACGIHTCTCSYVCGSIWLWIWRLERNTSISCPPIWGKKSSMNPDLTMGYMGWLASAEHLPVPVPLELQMLWSHSYHHAQLLAPLSIRYSKAFSFNRISVSKDLFTISSHSRRMKTGKRRIIQLWPHYKTSSCKSLNPIHKEGDLHRDHFLKLPPYNALLQQLDFKRNTLSSYQICCIR